MNWEAQFEEAKKLLNFAAFLILLWYHFGPWIKSAIAHFPNFLLVLTGVYSGLNRWAESIFGYL